MIQKSHLTENAAAFLLEYVTIWFAYLESDIFASSKWYKLSQIGKNESVSNCATTEVSIEFIYGILLDHSNT